MSTVFGMIISGKLPSKQVFENERILAIEDLRPVAPVHILIMPKKEIPSIQAMNEEDLFLHQTAKWKRITRIDFSIVLVACMCDIGFNKKNIN